MAPTRDRVSFLSRPTWCGREKKKHGVSIPLNLLPELLLLEVQCSIFAEADDDQRCACQLWDESLRKSGTSSDLIEAHCRVDCRRK